jgi:hypothetical protein
MIHRILIKPIICSRYYSGRFDKYNTVLALEKLGLLGKVVI